MAKIYVRTIKSVRAVTMTNATPTQCASYGEHEGEDPCECDYCKRAVKHHTRAVV